jgi:hypothetical protein
MNYRFEYHESHGNEQMGSHVHIYLSGSEREIKSGLEEIEMRVGKKIEDLGAQIFDGGTNYKIPINPLGLLVARDGDFSDDLEKFAEVVGVQAMSDFELNQLSRNYGSTMSRFAHNEKVLRRMEDGAAHLFGVGLPPHLK